MARVVRSCLVFHNIFLHINDRMPPSDVTADCEQLQMAEVADNNSDCQGQTIRDAIKQYLFAMKNDYTDLFLYEHRHGL